MNISVNIPKNIKPPCLDSEGYAYDGVKILAAALKNSNGDKEKTREALENTKNYVGISGVFNFSKTDHNGLSPDAFVMVKIKNGYTPQDLSNWQSILARALQAADVTAHDILQITLNPGLANWGRDYKYGAEAIEASVIPHTRMSIEKRLMVLRDYKTSVLITTPSSALQLANYARKNEINTNVFELKTLILIGESIDEEDRRALEESLHVKIWAHYGLSEVPGPAIAFECEAHEGLHINEDHFLPEIINPETGRVLPDGRFGELVLTTLTTPGVSADTI